MSMEHIRENVDVSTLTKLLTLARVLLAPRQKYMHAHLAATARSHDSSACDVRYRQQNDIPRVYLGHAQDETTDMY